MDASPRGEQPPTEVQRLALTMAPAEEAEPPRWGATVVRLLLLLAVVVVADVIRYRWPAIPFLGLAVGASYMIGRIFR